MRIPRIHRSDAVVLAILSDRLCDFLDLRRLDHVLTPLLNAIAVRDAPATLLLRVVADHASLVQFGNLVAIAAFEEARNPRASAEGFDVFQGVLGDRSRSRCK